MFPLWDMSIEPVIRAAAPSRIVEIGALRGETTTLMLDSLGDHVELHVIDPVPAFDPTEHEERFPGRYLFHRDLSLSVLPDLPAVDVALVDGDHNWYTVYNELRLLRESARRDNAALPVLIMHDVLWPYGRRDLYYAPEQIPEEFRQPHAQLGMRPGQSELVPGGRAGVSPQMHNALTEGGPRNGVMTAYDDFIAEHDKPVREVLVPIYFGLLIVVEEERLAAHPELAEVLDRLESSEGRQALLELSEQLRLRAVEMEHQAFNTNQRRIPHLYRRYLDLLKDSLLGEHYAENEIRLDYLHQVVRDETPFDPVVLEDPKRSVTGLAKGVEIRHESGARNLGNEAAAWVPYAAMGRQRLEHLERCLETIRKENVRGDFVSCGTSRGGDAIFMAGFMDANEMQRRVWVADRFRGPLRTKADEGDDMLRMAGDLDFVRDAFDRFDLLSDQIKFLQGDFADTLPEARIRRISLLRIEGHDRPSTKRALNALYKKVEVGGYVVIDNYRSPRVENAVKEFRENHGITDPVERADWGAVVWRKSEDTTDDARTAKQRPAARPPLMAPRGSETLDLSVVVVFHNMRREAERTLHSLSRAYQRDIDDLRYEVIAVENGSAEEQRLGEEFVTSFGPEFRYIDMGDDAPPSPVPAVNTGIARSRGDAVAVMIDGAHVLTPGVLHFGMLGLRAHEPAMVITQQWYMGPGQQPDPSLAGYDQAYEDKLFQKIGWPADGYRMFRVGHFIGERDWFDGMPESNCLFVPRTVLEQIGGMDESFAVPGGGYANLEFYERIGRQPDLTVVSILGEGSFHQVHGGTTTNITDIEARNDRLVDYRDDYIERKGKPYTGHRKPIHYVGAMTQPARRTRSRRIHSEAFIDDTGEANAAWHPTTAVPMPDEVKLDYTERYWHSLDWQHTPWLGERVERAPADLIAYQDIIARVRPDWIVETRSGSGGRALFLASICELVGHGRVLSVDIDESPHRPSHERITFLVGDPLAPGTIARIGELLGPNPNAMVVLGIDTTERLVAAFGGYAAFVTDESYVVLEDTITGGHPVWNGMGAGPNQAVRNIIKTTSEFVADRHMERFGPTFSPNGFLRRLSGRPRSTT